MEPLFGEWMKSVEASILQIVKDKGSSNPKEIAGMLGISEKNSITFVCRMVDEGKLTIAAFEAAQ
jgi:hypothetical protein